MKILFDCPEPFSLAHGGVQIQIERTKAALAHNGVGVDFVRWWDESQRPDLIHFFGNAPYSYLQQARLLKIPVVLTSYFSQTCNRSDIRLAAEALLIRTAMALPFGRLFRRQLKWHTYEICAGNVVGLEVERDVLRKVYGISAARISVVPLGLSETFLNARQAHREPVSNAPLICTGRIVPVKHSVELARLARLAECPILFVGKPFAEDEYWAEFKGLIDERWVKYHAHVVSEAEMIELLRAARGFVLMSDFENWSLAAHEAAACGLPLLLRDQKWARERFGTQVRFFRSTGVTNENVDTLRRFYADADHLSAPSIKLYSWHEVAQQLQAIYERALSTSS